MAHAGHFWPTDVWKKKIQKRALELDECYCQVHTRFHRSLNLHFCVYGGPKYIIWWHISDTNCELSRYCEVMMKFITHSSLLITDDVRLKGLPMSTRFHDKCDYMIWMM